MTDTTAHYLRQYRAKPQQHERNLQTACVKWLRYQYPNVLAFSIPNGGSRNVIEAHNLKLSGVLAGVPDLFIAEKRDIYGGMFVEMKSGKGRLSDNQARIISQLISRGYYCSICRSIDEFIIEVEKYLRS